MTSITYPSVAGGSEAVNYTYDAAWRQKSVCGTSCYVSSASYTPQNQPATWNFANGIQQNWSYNERGFPSQLRIGVSGNLSSIFDRSYTYDGGGNLSRLTDNKTAQPQVFRYDDRDRLISASSITQSIPTGTVVTVRAMGEDVDGWPTMELRVNGSTVKSWTVNSASWANYTYTLTAAINPGDTVDIVYTNDYSNGVDNRDLFVDSIAFGSIQTVQVESRAVSYDRSAIDGQDAFASNGSMWWNGALRLTQTYGYNTVGNLTSKEGASFSYGTQSSSCAAGALSNPHALVSGAGSSYCYDANGNMLSGGGRTYTWNAQNLPTSVTSGSVTESYSYNADDVRMKVTNGSTATIFVEGLYEEVIGGAIKKYYTLNGTTVAVREQSGTTSTVTSMHGDQLGSVSVVTTSSGAATAQEYDVWGKVRRTATQAQNPIQQTKHNYTGQSLDDTGLLFYHARYYDPGIGRFVSADSVVPGSASGGMDGIAVKPLTVDFHEGGFLSKLNQENGLGFWFQFNDDQKEQAGSPWGPAHVQALNRYSYVQNNPMRWVDPIGHYTEALYVNLYVSGWGYSTIQGSNPNAAYIDGQGNPLIRDPDTGVLYRMNNGKKDRLMRVHFWKGTQLLIKYVYESNTDFQDYKAHANTALSIWEGVPPTTIGGAVGGCAGAAIGGPTCFVGGAVLGAAGLLSASAYATYREGVEKSAAQPLYDEMQDVGAPKTRTHR
ncbi:MAG: hypothetical protein HGA19_08520 [Oscillochloris sp.]|nr:hypothetical protein [Oscillochloris sp.]